MLSKEDWTSLVTRMRLNGCGITDAEAATIIDYLAGEYGIKN